MGAHTVDLGRNRAIAQVELRLVEVALNLRRFGFSLITDPTAQFNGTVLRATASGFENAQQSQNAKAFGIVNEVSGFTASGSDYVASRYLRFRKGVQYKVELVTSSNNLPFVSGRFFWTSVGNSDEPTNKFYEFTVDNRQTYVADNTGNPVPADSTVSPDVNKTYFTLRTINAVAPPSALGQARSCRGLPHLLANRSLTHSTPSPNLSIFSWGRTLAPTRRGG